jgi:uncharacterized protein YybS (DUF2232 family)
MRQKLLPLAVAVMMTVAVHMLVVGFISSTQSSLLVLVGSALAFTVPWPVALLVLRQGPGYGITAALVSLLVLAAAGDAILGVAYLVQFGAASVAVPAMLTKGWSPDRAVLGGAGISLGGGLCALAGYALQKGKTPLALADAWARSEVERALAALKAADLPADVAQQTERMFRQLGDMLIELYPAMIILTIAAMSLVLVLFLVRRGAAWLPQQSPFFLWKVAENLVWVLIVSGSGALFLQGGWQRLAWNLLIIVLAIYFLQGLAILSYFFNIKGVPPAFRVLGYFLVVASFPLRVLAAGVGIFDLWIDFRKPRNHKD